MATISFNAAEVQPSSFDALPAGTYEAVIANSEAKPMKSGNGMGFNFEFEIISGDCKGRKVFSWITFEPQLHNLPMTITVAIDKNDPTRNVIKSYKPKKSAAAPAQQSGGSAAGGAAPWARP